MYIDTKKLTQIKKKILKNIQTYTKMSKSIQKILKTRPGDLVGAGPNWVTFWSKFGLF